MKKRIIVCLVFLFSINLVFADSNVSIQGKFIFAMKLFNSNKTDAAILQFKHLYKLSDKTVWKAAALYRLAECYVRKGDNAKALETLNQIIKKYSFTKYSIYATDLLEKLKTQKSVEKKKETSSEKLKKIKAEIQKKTENKFPSDLVVVDRNADLIKTSTKTTMTTKKNLDNLSQSKILIETGNDLYNNNKFLEALEAYQKANKLLPDNNVILFNLGLTYDKLNNYKKANVYFERVYKINPDDLEALKYVAYTYYKIKKPFLSYVYWKRLLQKDSNNKIALKYLQKLENEQGF